MLESQAYVNPAFCQQSEFLNNNNSSTPNNNNNHNVRETVSDNEFKIRDDQEEELIIDGRFSPRKFDGVVYAIGNGKVEFSKSPISGGSYHMLKPVTSKRYFYRDLKRFEIDCNLNLVQNFYSCYFIMKKVVIFFKNGNSLNILPL